MKLFILHLSDIHISSATDPILTRARLIVDAVKNSAADVDEAICVISGDIAFSGQDCEYQYAMSWLHELLSNLAEQIDWSQESVGRQVRLIAIPGNHDCNFSGASPIREIVREKVLGTESVLPEPEVLEQCLSVQRTFFDFMSAMDPHHFPSEAANNLSYVYRLGSSDYTVRFTCLNSAWVSARNEKQGSMKFPFEVIDSNKELNCLDFVLMHHPYNWFDEETARWLRLRIESVADIILTGHEHHQDARFQRRATGELNTYIEGGLLASSTDPHRSVFHCLNFDTDARKFRRLTFHWTGNIYEPGNIDHPDPKAFNAPWEEFSSNTKNVRGAFVPCQKFAEQLEDSGRTLVHKESGIVRLSDIYVCPTLFERSSIPRGEEEWVDGDDLSKLIADSNHLLITGDDNSGKTSLAKYVFQQQLASGRVPIFLDSSKKLPKRDHINSNLDDVFCEQYDKRLLTQFQQLDRKKRALVVDDYHKLKAVGLDKAELLAHLHGTYGVIVLIAHDTSLALEEMQRPEILRATEEPFKCFGIAKFGNHDRAELIDRWLRVQSEGALEPDERVVKTYQLELAVNTCLGNNFVPSYPVFILAILEATEAAMPVDTQASTHGYYYELFIKISLSRTGATNYNIASNYLAHLAYCMFKARKFSLSYDESTAFQEWFESEFALRKPLREISEKLVICNIVKIKDDEMSFRYKYIYYYFVASYLRDHINEPSIRQEISELSKKLYVEEYANIFLFLAHLSKDPFIIDEVLDAEPLVYKENEPSDLQSDVEFLNKLEADRTPLKLEDRTEASEAARKRADRARKFEDDESLTQTFEVSNPADPVIRLGGALRTMQIMGQLLKNYPGSLNRSRKEAIATACYNLGRRVISEVLQSFDAGKSDILEFYLQHFEQKHPTWTPQKTSDRARHSTYLFGRLLLFYVVRRIALSAGAPELEDTYRTIVEKDPNTAVKLIDASISIDRVGKFPTSKILKLAEELTDNRAAHDVLRLAVHEHLFQFEDTNYRQKEKVCKALNISLPRSLTTPSERKLLPAPSK